MFMHFRAKMIIYMKSHKCTLTNAFILLDRVTIYFFNFGDSELSGFRRLFSNRAAQVLMG